MHAPLTVRCYLGFSYLLSPAEERLLTHMVYFDQQTRLGHYTDFTRTQYMKRIGLREHAFDSAVRSLAEMGLITRVAESSQNRVHLSLNAEVYKRLIRICSASESWEKLSYFLDFNFRKLGRRIDEISDEELIELYRS